MKILNNYKINFYYKGYRNFVLYAIVLYAIILYAIVLYAIVLYENFNDPLGWYK